MEALLTYAINSCLRKFIKSAAGRQGSNLRVALSGGSVILKHLELNLRPVLKNLPVIVQRAFVQQLSITLPWTSLSLAQVQVRLDTVEIVLALQEDGDDQDSSEGEVTQGETVDSAADGSNSWLGSWQSYLHSLLCNLTVQVNNMVVKLRSRSAVTTLTLQNLTIANGRDSWIDALKEPEKWIKKLVEVNQLTVSLEELGSDGAVVHFPEPVLKTPKLQATVIAPALSILAGEVPRHDEFCVHLSVDVYPIKGTVSNLQIGWLTMLLRELSEGMAKVQPVDTGQQPAAEAEPEPPDPPVAPPNMQQQTSTSWLSAFTQEWETWLTDPQDASPTLTASFVAPAAKDLPMPTIHATLLLQGADVTLATAHPYLTHHRRSSSTTLAVPQLPPLPNDPSSLSSVRPPPSSGAAFTWSSPRTSHSCTQTRESSPAPPLSRRNSRSSGNFVVSSSSAPSIPPLPADILQQSKTYLAQTAVTVAASLESTPFDPSLIQNEHDATTAVDLQTESTLVLAGPSRPTPEAAWPAGSSPLRPSTPGKLSTKHCVTSATPSPSILNSATNIPPASARGRQSSTGSEVVPLLWLPSAADNSFNVQFQGSNPTSDVQILRACSVAGSVSRTVSLGSVTDSETHEAAAPYHVRKHSSEELELSLALGTSLELSVHVPDEPNARKARRSYKLCTMLQLKWEMLQVSSHIEEGVTLSSFSLQLKHMCLLRAVVTHLPQPSNSKMSVEAGCPSTSVTRPATADPTLTPPSSILHDPFNPDIPAVLSSYSLSQEVNSQPMLHNTSHMPPRAPTSLNGQRTRDVPSSSNPTGAKTQSDGGLDTVFCLGCAAADAAPGLDLQLHWQDSDDDAAGTGGWMGRTIANTTTSEIPVAAGKISCFHVLYPIGFVELLHRFHASCSPSSSQEHDAQTNSETSDPNNSPHTGDRSAGSTQPEGDMEASSDDAAVQPDGVGDDHNMINGTEQDTTRWSLKSLLKGKKIDWEVSADAVTIGGLSCCDHDAEAVILSFDHITTASSSSPEQQANTLLQQLQSYRGVVPTSMVWHAQATGFSIQMANAWVPAASWKGVKVQEGMSAVSNTMTAALLATRDTNPSSDPKAPVKISFATSAADMRFTAVQFSAVVAWAIDVIVEAMAKFRLPLLQRIFTTSQLKDLHTLPWLNAVIVEASRGLQLHVPPNNVQGPELRHTCQTDPSAGTNGMLKSVRPHGQSDNSHDLSQQKCPPHMKHPNNMVTAGGYTAPKPLAESGTPADSDDQSRSGDMVPHQKPVAMLTGSGVSLVLAGHACAAEDFPHSLPASITRGQQYLPAICLADDDIEVDLYPVVAVRAPFLKLHATQVMLPAGHAVTHEWADTPDDSPDILLPHLAKYAPKPAEAVSQSVAASTGVRSQPQQGFTDHVNPDLTNSTATGRHPAGIYTRDEERAVRDHVCVGDEERAARRTHTLLDVWQLTLQHLGVFGRFTDFSFVRSTGTYSGLPAAGDGSARLQHDVPLPPGDINTYGKKYIIAAAKAVLQFEPAQVGLLMQFSKSMSTGPMFAVMPYIPCTSTAMFDTSRYSIDCPDLTVKILPRFHTDLTGHPSLHEVSCFANGTSSAPNGFHAHSDHEQYGAENGSTDDGPLTIRARAFYMVYKTTNLWQPVSYPESHDTPAYESTCLSTLWNFSTAGMQVFADLSRHVASHCGAACGVQSATLVADLDSEAAEAFGATKKTKVQAVIQYGGLLSTFFESRCSLGHVKLWVVPDLLPVLKAASKMTDMVLPPLIVPGAVARRTPNPPADRSSTSLTAATLRVTLSTAQTPKTATRNTGCCAANASCGGNMHGVYSLVIACTDLAHISHDSPVSGESKAASTAGKPRRSVLVAAGVSVLAQQNAGNAILQTSTVLLPTHAQLVTYTTPGALHTSTTPSKTTTLRLPSLQVQLSLTALHCAVHVFQGFKTHLRQQSADAQVVEEKLFDAEPAAALATSQGTLCSDSSSDNDSVVIREPPQNNTCLGLQVDNWRVALMRDVARYGGPGLLGPGQQTGTRPWYFLPVDELLVLSGGQLLAGVQDWGQGVCTARMAVTNLDVAAVERASLARFTVCQVNNMVLDYTSAPAVSWGLTAAAGHLSGQNSSEEDDGIVLGACGSLEDLLATLQPPAVSGVQVNIQITDSPVRLHVHHVSAEALMQAAEYSKKAAAVAGSILSGELSDQLVQDALTSSTFSPVGVHNTCPVPFFIRQAGCNSVVAVAGGKMLSFFWSEASGEKLHEARQLQVACWQEGVVTADQLEWSEAVEVPILAAHQLTVPWSHGMSARIALTITRAPTHRYLVTIRTGLLIANRSRLPLTLAYKGTTPITLHSQPHSSQTTHTKSQPSGQVASPSSQAHILHLGCSGDESGAPDEIPLLPLYSKANASAQNGMSNSLQVLMEGSVWSKPLMLATLEPKAGRVETVPAGTSAPGIALSPTSPMLPVKEVLHFCLGLPHPVTGQCVLAFWPRYRLLNLLPAPVTFGVQQLPLETAVSKAAGVNDQDTPQMGQLLPGARASLSVSTAGVSLLHLHVKAPITDWRDFYTGIHQDPSSATASPFVKYPQNTTTHWASPEKGPPTAPHPHATPTRLSASPIQTATPILFSTNTNHDQQSSSGFTHLSVPSMSPSSPSSLSTSNQDGLHTREASCHLPDSPSSLQAPADCNTQPTNGNCVPTLASLQRTSSSAAAMLTSRQCSPTFSATQSLAAATPAAPRLTTSSDSDSGPWQLNEGRSPVSNGLQLPRLSAPGSKLSMVLEQHLDNHANHTSAIQSCSTPRYLSSTQGNDTSDMASSWLKAQDNDVTSVSNADLPWASDRPGEAEQLEVSAVVVPEAGGSGAADVMLLPNGLLVNDTAMPVQVDVVEPTTRGPTVTKASSSCPVNMPPFNPNRTYKGVIKALLPLPTVSTASPDPDRDISHWLELSSSALILTPGSTKLVALLSTHRTNSPAQSGLWAGAACVAVTVDVVTWTQPSHSTATVNPRKAPTCPPHQILRITVSSPLTVVNLSPSRVQLSLQGVMDNSHSGAFCTSHTVSCKPGSKTAVALSDAQLLKHCDPTALTHKPIHTPASESSEGVSLHLQMSHSNPSTCSTNLDSRPTHPSLTSRSVQSGPVAAGPGAKQTSSSIPSTQTLDGSSRPSTFLPCNCGQISLSIPGCARGRLCMLHSNMPPQNQHSEPPATAGGHHLCDSTVMYRLAVVDGRHTLLLWNDSQPSLLLHNTLSVELEVAHCRAGPPHAAHTAMQRPDKGVHMCKVFTLGPGKQLPLYADDLFESKRDPELAALEGEDTDEGGLLVERMSGQAPSSGFDPCILCVRLKGSSEWFPPFECEPGLHGFGSLAGRVVLTGPMTHISFTPRVSSSRSTPDLPSTPASQESSLLLPTRFHFFCRSLQVSLWDKDVQHSSTPSSPLKCPKELLCLSLDNITTSLQTESKALPPFTTFPPAASLKSTTLTLVIQDIQCDSYLSDPSGAVVITTRHESRRVLPGKHAKPAPGQPPLSDGLLLTIEWWQVLSTAEHGDMASSDTCIRHLEAPSGASTSNSVQRQAAGLSSRVLCKWVGAAHAQVPVLVVVVDDPLLLFGTRTMQRYLNVFKGNDTGTVTGSWQTGSSSRARLDGGQVGVAHNNIAQTSNLNSTDGGLNLGPGLNNAEIAQGELVPEGSGAGVTSNGVVSSVLEPAHLWVEIITPEAVLTSGGERLMAAAAAMCGPPMFVQRATCSDIRLMLDLHLAEGAGVLPISLDTNRSPFTLNAVKVDHIRVPWPVMKQALSAHYMAEALMNVPQVLGSFELLFNLTGLVGSVTQGVWDLVALPLAGLEERSAAAFLTALCRGSASLPYYLSRWTLTSISGFSSAFAKLLRTSISQRRSQLPEPPTSVMSAYRPRESALSISSIAGSVGRGVLGMIGYPLSGALDVVSAVSGGLATSTGITAVLRPQRPALPAGSIPAAASAGRELAVLQSVPIQSACLGSLNADVTITDVLYHRSGVHDNASDNASSSQSAPTTNQPYAPSAAATRGAPSQDARISQGHVATGSTVLITTYGLLVSRPGCVIPWLVMPLQGLRVENMSGRPTVSLSHQSAWVQTRLRPAVAETWVWVAQDEHSSTADSRVHARSNAGCTEERRERGVAGQDICSSSRQSMGNPISNNVGVEERKGADGLFKCCKCGAASATGSASRWHGPAEPNISMSHRSAAESSGPQRSAATSASTTESVEEAKTSSTRGSMSWLSRGVSFLTTSDSAATPRLQDQNADKAKDARLTHRDLLIAGVSTEEASEHSVAKGCILEEQLRHEQAVCWSCASRYASPPSGYASVAIAVQLSAEGSECDVTSLLNLCSTLR